MGIKPLEEWFIQAEYDIETAAAMLSSGRNIYAVFMCHLSIEKALKGLWPNKFKEDAPKTHNLIYLYTRLELDIPDNLRQIIDELNKVSIPTRYPETLEKLFSSYPKDETTNILNNSNSVLTWLKKQI